MTTEKDAGTLQSPVTEVCLTLTLVLSSAKSLGCHLSSSPNSVLVLDEVRLVVPAFGVLNTIQASLLSNAL